MTEHQLMMWTRKEIECRLSYSGESRMARIAERTRTRRLKVGLSEAQVLEAMDKLLKRGVWGNGNK